MFDPDVSRALRVLVGCEYSGRVRDAFLRAGHDAVSCDLVPSIAPGPHHVGDALELAYQPGRWDLGIFFPPCTYLTRSNAWRWDAIADQRAEALAFVQALMDAPIPRITIENPAGAIGTQIRPADQYVHPWHFGEPYTKQTGLWLKNLPRLVPAVKVKPEGVTPWISGAYGPRNADGSRTSGGVKRHSKGRSLTFLGIAAAMADQWGQVQDVAELAS